MKKIYNRELVETFKEMNIMLRKGGKDQLRARKAIHSIKRFMGIS